VAFSTQPSLGVISISAIISGFFEIAFLANQDSFESIAAAITPQGHLITA